MKGRDSYQEKLTMPATAIPFSIVCGFIPIHVIFQNVTDRISMEWWAGMDADSCLLYKNTAGLASVGTIAVGAGNTGGGTSPAMAGTYTGKANGTMTLLCTKAGDCETAEFKVTMPDGTVVEDVVTGASNTATEMAQGVTFKITNGTGDDLKLGDTFTSVLAAAGSIIIDKEIGITVGEVTDYPRTATVVGAVGSTKGRGFTIGLNVTANIANKVCNVYAE